MPTAFSRTLRSLDADGPRRVLAGVAAAGCLTLAWALWCGLAPITLYEVSSTARLEVDQAVTPIQSPLAGRVVSTQLAIGRQVAAGDILLELDTEAERLEIAEQQAHLAALTPQLRALREQIAAEEQAREQEKLAGRAASEQALSSAREAEAPVRFAENDDERLRQLRAEGLVPEREYQRAKAELQRSRAAAESQHLAVGRLAEEQRTRESDRSAKLTSLAADVVRLETQIPALEASLSRLNYEIERRRVRAPVSGRLGEAAVLRQGAVVRDGERLGAIVPESRLAIVAQFPPEAAMGRIRAGQLARLRLDGFPWTQYGTVPATVTRVATEVREGSVRVELAVTRTSSSLIPLQHGLPGTIEIEVERVTPAALILRNAGRMVATPRPAFAVTAGAQ
ncbi:MAG TPA: HlyD family efflux transporter periplasmic adaptor subunit [Bryobacteraceae bacterium]|nr:HlyD family efflux transporter periplasmic adaptor subunit [Bryobacteraceae bacterium]